MKPTLILLVGPPGSGKSTEAKLLLGEGDVYVNQDSQGKAGHFEIFTKAIQENKNIIVDRMNFSIDQRNRYLKPAKNHGYYTQIIVLHVPMAECLERCNNRTDHETIKDAETAEKAVRFFFSKYERVEDSEADNILRWGWKEEGAVKTIVSDLDGTLANIDHRLHYVRSIGGKMAEKRENGRKKPNWKKFFENMNKDSVNIWCKEILDSMYEKYPITYATGRPEDYMGLTNIWLQENGLVYPGFKLFSRLKGDFRKDSIVKEIILEFEIKTRYDILMVIDDRKQVTEMWRNHGYVVLQCAEGDF